MSHIARQDPFDEFFRGFFVRPVEFGQGTADVPAIKVDVKEDEKAYLVQAELPGVKKEDIQVSVDASIVSITAERKQEKDAKNSERVLRSERYFGKVARSFQLVQEIDEAQSGAKFNDGVLELTLPKKAAAQAKRLSIQ